MGRRLRGASMRAEKRMKLDAEEMVDSAADKVDTQDVSTKKDEELFVIDTTPEEPSKKQLAKKAKMEKSNKTVRNPSAKEQAQIEKLVQSHSASQLKEIVKESAITSRRAKRQASVKPTFDLWDAQDTPKISTEPKYKKEISPGIGSAMAGTKPSLQILTSDSSRPALPPPTNKDRIVTVEVAKSGQSYNPDSGHHAQVLNVALSVEQKRQAAEMEAKAPVATGMSDETRALLLGDSDSEDEEEQELEGDDDAKDGPIVEKKATKLTRAQRNKQKRLREEQRQIENRKRQKKLQNAVAEAKTLSKVLKREELEQKERRAKTEELRLANIRTKGANVYQQVANENPMHAHTLPVALSSELKQSGGSLRAIKPKGSLITDRIISFADRDMTAKKQTKTRKRIEGKRRKLKVKVRGKGHAESKEGAILG